MTIIVRREIDGKIFSFIKGADSVILPRLISSPDNSKCLKNADDLSREGLRTLVVAFKEIQGE
jgi:magnesium-transporting ATPase (P-type)